MNYRHHSQPAVSRRLATLYWKRRQLDHAIRSLESVQLLRRKRQAQALAVLAIQIPCPALVN